MSQDAPDNNPNAVPLRLAPHNIEAEQALLGAILTNNESFDRVSDFLLPEHFYEEIHVRVYDAIRKFIHAGKIADPVTLKNFLPDHDLGGFTASDYLTRLVRSTVTIFNAAQYGRVIYELAMRRNLIRIGEDMVNQAYDSPIETDPKKQIENVERQLFTLAESGSREQGYAPFETALNAAIEIASLAYEREGGLSGIATGLIDLDRRLGGLQKSDLIIIAGRPAMGKTSLATNIAYTIAKTWQGDVNDGGARTTHGGGVVGFASLEMSAEQLATRIISEQAGVPSSKIRRGDIDKNEFRQIVDASKSIQSIPFYIDQTGGLSISNFVTRARRLKRQFGLDVLFVDYLQLLTGSSRRGESNRVQELTEITTTLKALAKELNVPIIALSQLSRQVEAREDKRPQLSDLRESGSIEQDADVVLFVFREEYYLKNREPKMGTEEYAKWQEEMEKVHGMAELIIGKQRHGPTGTVRLHFDSNITKFSNHADQPS